ncbi:MAG: ParB/RepB/Spo0J family partition protein [Planctomycetota bacterium]|nr:ParB/RepB/Spo0J family partition protein [Planctomycetota bacterium]
MAKSRGLGRGLDALMAVSKPKRSEAADAAPASAREVDIGLVLPSPWQPRQAFDSGKLNELAGSIRENGMIQPLVVRTKGDGFEVIAGERRLRAARDVLGWKTVPVIVMDAEDARMRELALVENLQRADLNAMEIAEAYRALAESEGMTHENIARRVGVSRGQVTNMLRLLELPEEVKRLVAENSLSAGSARAILGMNSPLAQLRLARRAVEEGLSTRKIEELAAERKSDGGRDAKPPIRAVPPHVADLEDRLLRYFGTKVTVDDKNGKGRIVIEYYSVDDADRLLKRMGLPEE